MRILEEKPLTLAEAKEILTELEKERDALGYEQKVTLDFMKTYVQLKKEDAEQAKKELKEKLPELKEHHVAMLINILPETVDEVRILFSKERVELDEEKMKQILEILDKIRPPERIKYKAFSGIRTEEKEEEQKEKSEEAALGENEEKEQS